MENPIQYLSWKIATEIAGARHNVSWSVENKCLIIEDVDAEDVDRYLSILRQGAASLIKLEDTVKGLEAALTRNGQATPTETMAQPEVVEPEMPSVGSLTDPESLIVQGGSEFAPLFTNDVRDVMAEKAKEVAEALNETMRIGRDPAAVLEYYKKSATAAKMEKELAREPKATPVPAPKMAPKDDFHVDFPEEIRANRSVTDVVRWLRDHGHASTEDSLVKILMENASELVAFRTTEATEFAFRKRIRHALDFLNGAI